MIYADGDLWQRLPSKVAFLLNPFGSCDYRASDAWTIEYHKPVRWSAWNVLIRGSMLVDTAHEVGACGEEDEVGAPDDPFGMELRR